MDTRRCVAGLLLMAHVVISVELQMNCTAGLTCFPHSDIVPEDYTSSDMGYYCCLDRNMTRHGNTLADGQVNCTCLPDLELDSKIQRWAEDTKALGRMCNREQDCAGSPGNSSIGQKFLFCCPRRTVNGTTVVETDVTIYDGDKEEFIGCRCKNDPVPAADPTAYIVPQTPLYNSSGESCSYDNGCDNRPARKCTSSAVTFCCYGSRSIATANDGTSLTRCTCTNEVYGEHCEVYPISISQTTQPCLTECSGKGEDELCSDDSSSVRCCPNNMVVSASISYGNFSTCTCTTGGSHKCTTSSAMTNFGVSLGAMIASVVWALLLGNRIFWGIC